MISRILREPFLYFVAIGVILFVAFGTRNDTAALQDPKQIIITQDRVDQLIGDFQAVWNRPPQPRELGGMVESYIYEEILVREALALGMDKGDSVIRQRLRLKMEFLASGAAQAIQPNEQEIQTFYQENIEMFSRPDRLAFEQVYLGENPDTSSIETARNALNLGQDPQTVGQRGLLTPSMRLSENSQVNSLFGDGFFEQLWSVNGQEWQGPVRSGYGLHLVRITQRETSAARPLADVQDAVLAQLRDKISKEFAQAQKAALLADYTVVRPQAAQ